MRKIHLIYILLVIFPVYLKGQHPIKTGENKVGNNIFVAKKENSKLMSVSERNSIIETYQKNRKSLQVLPFVEFADGKTINLVFKDVLGVKRIKELVPEKRLLLEVYLNGQGKVTAVHFLLNPNTYLTVDEIAQLNSAIKKGISIVIPAKVDKSKLFAPFFQNVQFEKLLASD